MYSKVTRAILQVQRGQTYFHSQLFLRFKIIKNSVHQSMFKVIQTRSYIYSTFMTSLCKILFIFIVFQLTNAFKVLQRVLLSDPDALCLDGSPAAYFVYHGKSTKFLLNFEGGGWCGSPIGMTETIQNCYNRSKHFLGSSLFYPPTVTFYQGAMSDHPNNIFNDWNVAYLRYCDGGGHQGYKKDPVLFKGEKLYFRGHSVTKGQLDSLEKNYKLFSQATDIVVTGQSAGGLATYMWSNYIRNKAQKTAKVWAIPDSGIFLDSLEYRSQKPEYKNKFFNLLEITNKQVDPPTEECVKANPTQKWKCMFAAHLYQHVKVPLFAINSLYDSWSLSYLLIMECNTVPSLAACKSDQLKYIEEYRRNTSLLIQKIAAKTTNGAWAIACSNHVYTLSDYFYSISFRVPVGSKNSAAFAVKRWMEGEAGSHLHLDTVNWPGNRPCSGERFLTEN